MSFVDSLKKGLFGSEDDYDDQYMDDGPQMVNNNSGLGVAGDEEEDKPEESAAPKVAAAPAASAPTAAPAARPAAGGGKGALTAPMPGNLVDVKVKAGDSVKKGDVLVVLEAMKMENEIMAPHDAKVAQVLAAKGATVNTGDVLVVLE